MATPTRFCTTIQQRYRRRTAKRVGRWLHEASGYSLLEVSVASTLLILALTPLSLAVWHFTVNEHNEKHVIALALAREHMEQTLHERTYFSAVRQVEEGRWRINRQVDLNGDQVTIVVQVYGRRDVTPLVELVTIRLN